MTAQQPEAVKLASEYRETMPADVLHLWARDAVGALRRLHEEAVDLRVLSSSLLNKNGGLQLAVWAVQNANSALQARVQELEAERDHFRGATEMVSEEQKRPTYPQVVAAWNAQADEHNPWDELGEDEKIEWTLKCCDQFRAAVAQAAGDAA